MRRLAVMGAWMAATAAVAVQAQAQVDDTARQFTFAIDEEALAGAPDRSALNHPLGPADRLFVRDGHFFRVGADGQPGTADDQRVRLFGISLSFATNFPSDQDAVRLARQLRKAGFNAVRLHHMDFAPGRDTDKPRGILTPDPYPTLNEVAANRLRHFIEVLAREGLYVNLNLYVSYRFRPEVDGVPNFDSPSNRLPIGESVHVYHPRMVELQESYARKVIDAAGLKNNPALAMVEISNEASLMAAWTRKEWVEYALPSAYAPVLREKWNRWAATRYGSIGAACKAWGTCSADRSEPLELVSRDSTERASSTFGALVNRAQAKLKQWMPDDGKPTGEALRLRDFLAFLADTDRAYFDRMRAVVHDATDARVPVTGTQMYYGGVMNFDSQAGMDYIDEHRYVDHPTYPTPGSEQSDWFIRNVSYTGDEMDKLLALSFRHDRRKPFVLSEFNLPYPSQRAAEVLPIVSSVAALQDWDGLFFFDYLDGSTWSTAPSNFTLRGEWGKYALAGQSAQIFRQQWIAPLRTQLDVPMPADTRAAIAASDVYEGLEKTLAQAGVVPADAWRYRVVMDTEARAMAPPARPQPAAQPVQVEHDAQRGYLTMDAPNVRGLFGGLDAQWRGPAGLQARSLATAPDAAAQLLLTPLDEQPLARSRHLLLTVGGPTVGSQPGSIPARPKQVQPYKNMRGQWTLEPDPGKLDQPSGTLYGHAPAWISRPLLCVRLAGAAPVAALYPLDGQGRRMAPLDAALMQKQGNAVAANLSAGPAGALSPWYEIVLTDTAEAGAAGTPDCPAAKPGK
ncbi:capsular biosynthesis protein [Bordetella genomosp. 13]|uniref:capsular biosynthesis protein n=1 Tax=Bordetella genomosp. 13 TaxID=463040 RepID=UPI0011AADCE8|nr:capsular biosynthesis protein [Bordetella genomosp. 13]